MNMAILQVEEKSAAGGSVWRILLPSLVVSFGGSFQSGFQTVCMNPSERTFTRFINASYHSHTGGAYFSHSVWVYVWPAILTSQLFGAIIGTCFVRTLLESRLGRKRSLYLTSSGFLLGLLLESLAKPLNSWELLVGARLGLGVAQGLHSGLQPVYFNEISPKHIRGLIGSITRFVLEFGYLLSSILAIPDVLGDEEKWPFMFVVVAAVNALAFLALPFLPESPKYLAAKGDYGGAAAALRFYGRDETGVKEELEEMRRELDNTKLRDNREDDDGSKISWRELFTTPYIRKGILLGLTVIFAATYSGPQALAYFSTSIIQSGGLSPSAAQFATAGVSAPIFIGAVLGGVTLDRFGRRPLLLGAFSILLVLNIVFIVFAHLSRVYGMLWAGYANIGVFCLFMLSYGVGPSLLTYLLTAELVPFRARSMAHSIAMVAQWTGFASTSLIIYPLNEAFNEFSFILHIIPLSLAIVYLYFALPETKNKSTLEIIRQLGYKDTDNTLIIKTVDDKKGGAFENGAFENVVKAEN